MKLNWRKIKWIFDKKRISIVIERRIFPREGRVHAVECDTTRHDFANRIGNPRVRDPEIRGTSNILYSGPRDHDPRRRRRVLLERSFIRPSCPSRASRTSRFHREFPSRRVYDLGLSTRLRERDPVAQFLQHRCTNQIRGRTNAFWSPLL